MPIVTDEMIDAGAKVLNDYFENTLDLRALAEPVFLAMYAVSGIGGA